MIQRSFLRRVFPLLALILLGTPVNAQAQTDIDFSIYAAAPSGICSVTSTAIGQIFATWNTTNAAIGFWEPMSSSGAFTLTFRSTGAPGDRDCYATGSNTPFTNGSVTFLGANNLSLTSSGSPVYIGGETTRAINLSIRDIPNTPTTTSLAFDLRWFINGVPNYNAPIDVYTSTLTITLSNTSI